MNSMRHLGCQQLSSPGGESHENLLSTSLRRTFETLHNYLSSSDRGVTRDEVLAHEVTFFSLVDSNNIPAKTLFSQ